MVLNPSNSSNLEELALKGLTNACSSSASTYDKSPSMDTREIENVRHYLQVLNVVVNNSDTVEAQEKMSERRQPIHYARNLHQHPHHDTTT